jgi:hypothetical protein
LVDGTLVVDGHLVVDDGVFVVLLKRRRTLFVSLKRRAFGAFVVSGVLVDGTLVVDGALVVGALVVEGALVVGGTKRDLEALLKRRPLSSCSVKPRPFSFCSVKRRALGALVNSGLFVVEGDFVVLGDLVVEGDLVVNPGVFVDLDRSRRSSTSLKRRALGDLVEIEGVFVEGLFVDGTLVEEGVFVALASRRRVDCSAEADDKMAVAMRRVCTIFMFPSFFFAGIAAVFVVSDDGYICGGSAVAFVLVSHNVLMRRRNNEEIE